MLKSQRISTFLNVRYNVIFHKCLFIINMNKQLLVTSFSINCTIPLKSRGKRIIGQLIIRHILYLEKNILQIKLTEKQNNLYNINSKTTVKNSDIETDLTLFVLKNLIILSSNFNLQLKTHTSMSVVNYHHEAIKKFVLVKQSSDHF